MKGTVAIQIPRDLEEPPEAHGTTKEICDVLKIDITWVKAIAEIAEKIATKAEGRVDVTLESYLSEITDPRELVLLSYSLGKAVKTATYDSTMPEIVRESMKAGAHIAMQEISAACGPQQQQPAPGPEPDVMIQSPGEDFRMYG